MQEQTEHRALTQKSCQVTDTITCIADKNRAEFKTYDPQQILKLSIFNFFKIRDTGEFTSLVHFYERQEGRCK